MSPDSEERVEFSGDGDDREDLTPGEDVESDLFDDPDPETDYEGAAETWIGEPATTEITIETVGGIDVKQFVLREPDSEGSMGRIMQGILAGDQYTVCKEIVDEPQLTPELWENQMTGREQSLLFDHALAWIRIADFVDMQAMLEAMDDSEW